MGIIDFMRNGIRSFLKIEPALAQQIIIQQRLDHNGNAFKNRVWYRGDSQELSDMYSQLDVPSTMFWKAKSTRGMDIRKIHTGLPALIIDILTNIIVSDYNGVDIKDAAASDLWQDTYTANGGDELIEQFIRECLIVGDGAFKISFDTDIDDKLPLIDFYPAERVEFSIIRGRIIETIFSSDYKTGDKHYTLKEHYGKGYIKYRLYAENGSEVKLTSITQTAELHPVEFDKSVMLAVPCIFGKSAQYEGRGESILNSKIDCFDALDETWSQWLDALRAGRAKEYIPESLIPRKPSTGTPIRPNAFDNRFIAIGDDMSERAQNKVQVEQPSIPHESYLSTYITALDLCLQGIISPSTLGIDVKKIDNAEAQREKEKATLYTRNKIVQLVEKVIPELVNASLCGYKLWHKQPVEKTECSVKFGEYANPSFEAVVETVAKAKQGGVMSIEACIEELYGDSKTEDWKQAEINRIKAEQGIIPMDDSVFTE